MMMKLGSTFIIQIQFQSYSTSGLDDLNFHKKCKQNHSSNDTQVSWWGGGGEVQGCWQHNMFPLWVFGNGNMDCYGSKETSYHSKLQVGILRIAQVRSLTRIHHRKSIESINIKV